MTPQLKDPSLQKYLSKLRKQLQVLPRNELEDVLKELESHVYEELQQGISPAGILERLGKPEDYARSFLEQYSDQLTAAGKLPEHARFMLKQALLPALIAALAFIGLMSANTLWIFADLIQHSKISLLRAVQMIGFSLPAIVVVVLPVCALFLIPNYIYGLRGSRAPNALRSPRVWGVTLLTGLLLSGLGFALQELVVPAANRQTVEIMKDMMNETRKKGTDELIFSDQADVRSLAMGDAYQLLQSQNAPNSPEVRRQHMDYYNKLFLPMEALSFSLYGLLTASLMLSGLFQPVYTFVMIGIVMPLGLAYTFYAIATNAMQTPGSLSPLLAAFLPDLVIAGISLVFLLGLLLARPEPAND
ncbi:MAG: LptF/LptG family permease [Candidatus Sericytochromatia bacterium]